MRITVVGAGLMGACTAWRLTERGHDVEIVERFAPGHSQGSSHGRSRIVRKAYPDRFYTEIMEEAYPMWRELEDKSGRVLLHEVGLLYFGSRDSENLREMAEGLRSLGVRHEVLEAPTSLVAKFRGEGSLNLMASRDDVGIWQPEAGWVRADHAVRVALDLALAGGAKLSQATWPPGASNADRVVLCAGPWIREFVDLPVTVTRQSFTYIRAEHRGPVWIEDSSNNLYGFPTEPGADSVKIAAHRPGPKFDPNEEQRTPQMGDAETALDFARRRLGIDAPEIVEEGVCLYSTTPDEHFRIGRLEERTFYASPCSGHGFKFGPWIGRLMADAVEGKVDLERYAPFVWRDT